MTRKRQLLEHLISPISLQRFYSDYFEKRLLICKTKGHDHFPKLFRLDDLDRILSGQEVGLTHIKVFKDGEEVPPYLFEKRRINQDQRKVSVGKLLEYVQAGHTLILNDLNELNDEVGKFNKSLATELEASIHTNLYLTPGGNRGFDPHFDTHDVIILQQEGEKEWTFFESEIPLVSDQIKQKVKKKKTLPLKVMDKCVLAPGDVLYIPRGIYHSATSVNSRMSMHLTVGIRPINGFQLIEELAEIAQEELIFRQSVPNEFMSNEQRSAYFEEFKEKLIILINQTSWEDLTKKKVQERSLRTTGEKRGLLVNVLNALEMGEHSVLKVRSDLSLRTTEEGISQHIHLPHKVITVPVLFNKTIKRFLEKEEVNVSSILDMGTPESKLKILKRFVRQGFLEVVVKE